MSNENDKVKHSTRLQRAWNSIKRQLRIARAHGKPIEQPHRLVKHHVMDCGQPHCTVCGNPRKNKTGKNKDKLTVQEKRNNQKTQDE